MFKGVEKDASYHRKTEKKYSFLDFITLSFDTQTVSGLETVEPSHIITKIIVALQKLVDELL